VDTAKRTDRIIVIVLIALAVVGAIWLGLSLGSSASSTGSATASSVTEQSQHALTIESFDGKRAGIVTGSFHDTVLAEVTPNSQIYEYSTVSDLVEALHTNKIDYFLRSIDEANYLSLGVFQSTSSKVSSTGLWSL